MQLIKKTKKGFTLVELIVVIAIVAILAAVSVVSYIAFINKGNESADIQLIKQLNTCLQADEALHGTRETPSEVFEMMEENGFIIENLTKTKSGYDIVWDQKNNRFALLNNFEKVYGEDSFGFSLKHQTWVFADSKQEAEQISKLHYAVYLTKIFEPVTEINVKAGLDVGENTIPTVNYINTEVSNQTVSIRTSDEGMVLNVNGPTDTVHHYNFLEELTIHAVDKSNSYHEHGQVRGKIILEEGHVVLESTASVGSIHVTADSSDDFSVSQAEGAELGFVTASNPSVLVTSGENANVEVEDNEVVQDSSTQSALFYNTKIGFGMANTTFPLDGKTTLLADLDLNGKAVEGSNWAGVLILRSNENVNIDLNGYQLTFVDIPAFYGSLTIFSSTVSKGIVNFGDLYIGNNEPIYRTTMTFDNCDIHSAGNIIHYYGWFNIRNSICTTDGMLTINGTSTYSTFNDVNTFINAENSTFNGRLYLAGYGDCEFINCVFNNENCNVYCKAGEYDFIGCTFNTVCSSHYKYDYVEYLGGYFSMSSSLVIDEIGGYKGFGEVNIGHGNTFNLTGDYADECVYITYNLTETSETTARLHISSEINEEKVNSPTKYVAYRICRYDGTKECKIYFKTLARANAFQASDFTSGTVTELGEVVEIN